MTDPKDTSFDINFFRPLPGIARDNTRIILLFIAIWAISVFGFQFLLILTNEPTPEDSLIVFNEAWPKIERGEISRLEQQAFARNLLLVLGKNVTLKEADKVVLVDAFNLTLRRLDPAFVAAPAAAAALLGLGDQGFDPLLFELLPFSLKETVVTAYSEALPAVMQTYCMHPRGPLTDFTFLGFPFHYWYTAQFLLILFVVLCLLYAIRIEKIYKKHDFVEEHD